MSEWSDIPPSVDGTYWARWRGIGDIELPAVLSDGVWLGVDEYGSEMTPAEAARMVQFGRRIPTNAELAESYPRWAKDIVEAINEVRDELRDAERRGR